VGFTLTGPDGKVVAQGKTDPKKTEFDVSAPADGKTGEYALTLEAEGALSLIIPFTEMPKEVLDTGWRQVTFVRQPKVAFLVPAGCKEATLEIAQHMDANAVSFYDGQGNLALRRCWVGAEERAQRVKIAPRPDQQGQAWLLSFGDKTKRNLLTLPKTLPPFVAIDQARMFAPAGK